MRNLELLSVRQVDAGGEFQGAQCVCVDYDSGNVFAASPATIVGLSPQNEQVSIIFFSINNPHFRNIVFILIKFYVDLNFINFDVFILFSVTFVGYW